MNVQAIDPRDQRNGQPQIGGLLYDAGNECY